MAAAGAHLPPWDPGNVEEGQLVKGSIYAELLNRSRVVLYNNLQLEDMWSHLRQLHVLTRIQETEIKHNRTGPDMVLELLDRIERGSRWQYHGLIRAMSLTNQGYLIPRESCDQSVDSGTMTIEGSLTASSARPPWDKSNLQQGQLISGSRYAELITKSRVSFCKNLKLDGLWKHLLKLEVISETEETRLKFNKAEPEVVAALLDFIECGPQWRYHGLMRAMALSGQTYLIPQDELDREIYTDADAAPTLPDARQPLPELPPKDQSIHSKSILDTDTSSCEPEGVRKLPLLKGRFNRGRSRFYDLDTALYPESIGPQEGTYYKPVRRPLSADLVRVIMKHSSYCQQYLMRTHLFAFEGDRGDDTIDISQIFINVTPTMKDGHAMEVPMKESEILEAVGDSLAPRIIKVQAQPGDGKTSFARHTVYRWSIEFLKQKIDQNGNLKENPKWTIMVYLRARDVKTTVEAAIREQLGGTERDQDLLMAHIEQGEGVAVFIDALDELRDPKALAKIKDYVHACQKRGGPTVLITCRTDVCDIDAKEFDRLLTLKGFSDEQGLEYVKLYTEKHEVQKAKPSGPSPVLSYVMNHKEEMKSVLSNPLRLNIFCSLAVRGELDLDDKEGFNIAKLFIPLERHLLKRGGVKVSEEQSQRFYKLCMHLLLEDLQEFPGSLLEEFNIIESYHVFLRKSDKRDSSGALVPFYSFNHEMVLEFFASRYIHTLNTKERMSFLLAICCDPYLRTMQKIVLQLLLHEGKTEHKLIQTVIRSMLILQFNDTKWTWKKTVYDLMHLRNQIETNASLSDILHSNSFKIKNTSSICKIIDSAFDKHSDAIRATKWFQCLKENGTMDHVVDCLQSFPPQLRDLLMENTMVRLLPDEYEDEKGITHYVYPVSSGLRWADLTKNPAQHHQVIARSCSDTREALIQHADIYPSAVIEKLHIKVDYCSGLWEETGAASWSEQEWDQLLTAASGKYSKRGLCIRVHESTTLTQLLSCLSSHAQQLLPCKKVKIRGGTAYFGDLLKGVSECRLKGLALQLKDVHVQGAQETSQENIQEPGTTSTDEVLQAGIANWTGQQLLLSVPDKIRVTGLLSQLQDNAIHLSQGEEALVDGGRIELEDLVTCLSRSTERKLNLKLQDMQIILPNSLTIKGYPDNMLVDLQDWSDNQMLISVPETTPVTGLLSCMPDHAAQLSVVERIVVKGGRADLGDLVTCGGKCLQEGITLELQSTHIEIPDGDRSKTEGLGTATTILRKLQAKLRILTRQQMWVSVPITSSVTDFVLCLLDHVEYLALVGKIIMEDGTAELGDLKTCLPRFSQAKLQLVLYDTQIFLPEGLIDKEDGLYELTNSPALQDVLYRAHWVTEIGDIWQSQSEMLGESEMFVCAFGKRMAEVWLSGDEIHVHGCCPSDASEALGQHSLKQSNMSISSLHVHTNEYHGIWGSPDEGCWSKEAWDKLLQVDSNRSLRELWVFTEETTPLSGFLSSLLGSAAQYSHCKINVPYGLVQIEDLAASAATFEEMGIKLTLSSAYVVVPERLIEENYTLQEQIDTCRLVCSETNWIREDGEYISQSALHSLVSPRMYRYEVGNERGVEVRSKNAELYVFAWCPGDAVEALAQHTSKISDYCKVLHIYTNHYRDSHGQPSESMNSKQEWARLIQAMPKKGLSDLWLFVDENTSLNGLLSSIGPLSQCKITVPYGTVKLEDVVACASRCEEQGLKLTLSSPYVVISEGLRADRVKFNEIVNMSERVCDEPNWITNKTMYVSQSDLLGACRESTKIRKQRNQCLLA